MKKYILFLLSVMLLASVCLAQGGSDSGGRTSVGETVAVVTTPTPTSTTTSNPPIEVPIEEVTLHKNGTRMFLDQLLKEDSFDGEFYIPLTVNEIIELTDSKYNWSIINFSEKDAVVSAEQMLIGRKKNEKAEIEIKTKDGKLVKLEGVKRLFIRVVDESNDLITTETTLLTYRDVLDNFGKRIANQYAVVQLTIRNDSSHNQFFIQDVGVILDPRQCTKVQEYFQELKPFYTENERKSITKEKGSSELLTTSSTEYFNKCVNYYREVFRLPSTISPIDRNVVLGVGDAGVTRSKRKIGFSALKFAAEMGSVFTGLGLLGSDGVKGFNFLGSTIMPSADTAVPNTSNNKYENLKKAMPEGPVIVNSRDFKIINLFIPSEKIFSNSKWMDYKQSLKKGNGDEAFELKIMTELFLVSQVKGILINDESPQVTSKPGGGINNLFEFKKP